MKSKNAPDPPPVMQPSGGSSYASEPATNDMMSDAERQLMKALQSTD